MSRSVKLSKPDPPSPAVAPLYTLVPDDEPSVSHLLPVNKGGRKLLLLVTLGLVVVTGVAILGFRLFSPRPPSVGAGSVASPGAPRKSSPDRPADPQPIDQQVDKKTADPAYETGKQRSAVLVPGDPELSQDMVEQYYGFVENRYGLVFVKLPEGLRQDLKQIIVSDWKKGDKSRMKAFLDDRKWWKEYPKLSKAERIASFERKSGRSALYMKELEKGGNEARHIFKGLAELHSKQQALINDWKMEPIRNIGP